MANINRVISSMAAVVVGLAVGLFFLQDLLFAETWSADAGQAGLLTEFGAGLAAAMVAGGAVRSWLMARPWNREI